MKGERERESERERERERSQLAQQDYYGAKTCS